MSANGPGDNVREPEQRLDATRYVVGVERPPQLVRAQQVCDEFHVASILTTLARFEHDALHAALIKLPEHSSQRLPSGPLADLPCAQHDERRDGEPDYCGHDLLTALIALLCPVEFGAG